jgi:hypothetical protein
VSSIAIPSRRGFLLGAGALLAAPAIVRVSALMPVSVVEEEGWRLLECAKASWTQIAISGKRPDWLDLTTLRRHRSHDQRATTSPDDRCGAHEFPEGLAGMTDERAKEIADSIRQQDGTVEVSALFMLKLYDDVQALKSALSGLAFLGIGGSIKRGGE